MPPLARIPDERDVNADVTSTDDAFERALARSRAFTSLASLSLRATSPGDVARRAPVDHTVLPRLSRAMNAREDEDEDKHDDKRDAERPLVRDDDEAKKESMRAREDERERRSREFERRECELELERSRALELARERDDLRARSKALELDLREMNKAIGTLRRRASALAEALADARRDGDNYRTSIAEIRMREEELVRENELARARERAARAGMEVNEREATAARGKMRALEEENERLTERLRQSERRENEGAKTAQRFHALAEASAREVEVLRRANDAATRENAELRERANETRREIEKERDSRQFASILAASARVPVVSVPNEEAALPTTRAAAAAAAPSITKPASSPATGVTAPEVSMPAALKTLDDDTIPGTRGDKENAPMVAFDNAPFDAAEYKRRMREGSGFFYDMAQKDAPLAPEVRRAASARARPGNLYASPPEARDRKPSYDEWMKSLAALDKENMRLCLERSALEDQINRLPAGAGRNMLERERKAGALERLEAVQRAIRVNRDMLKSAKCAR